MREGNPNRLGTTFTVPDSKSGANSLFRNILAVSPCGSGFCPDPDIPPDHKSLEMRPLGKREENNVRGIYQSQNPHPSRKERD